MTLEDDSALPLKVSRSPENFLIFSGAVPGRPTKMPDLCHQVVAITRSDPGHSRRVSCIASITTQQTPGYRVRYDAGDLLWLVFLPVLFLPRIASAVTSRARCALPRVRAASATKRQSKTVNWASRLASSPDR